MTEYLYYLLWYRLNNQDGYLIWLSADLDTIVGVSNKDRVMLDELGQLITSSSPAQAITYATRQGWKIEQEEPGLHNLDIVQTWLKQPSVDTVDCQEFLVAWNLFTDVSVSVNDDEAFIASSKITNRVYNKLFWGNNLLPVGEHYVPVWSVREMRELKRVFKSGFKLFTASLPTP